MVDRAADTSQSSAPHRGSRTRMSAMQRREQLIDVGRRLFADKGFDGTSIEEIAALAKVSKPVVYEHFGDKDGLYAVVIDREMTVLMGMLTGALTSTHPRILLAQAATALFDYIDANTAGFRVLLRPNPRGATFGTVIRDVAAHLEDQLVPVCKRYGYPTKLAPLYAHMLVGMVGLTGEWWAEVRKPGKDEVIAQVVNMAWNGVSRLEPKPQPVRFTVTHPASSTQGRDISPDADRSARPDPEPHSRAHLAEPGHPTAAQGSDQFGGRPTGHDTRAPRRADAHDNV